MIIIAKRLYAILSRLGCSGSLSLISCSSVTLTSIHTATHIISRLRMCGTVARYVSVHTITQKELNRAGTALTGELVWHGSILLWLGSVALTLYTQTVPNCASMVLKSSVNRL